MRAIIQVKGGESVKELIRRMTACGVPESRAQSIAESFKKRRKLRVLEACVRALEAMTDG